jgi:hypothetical protein
MTVAADVATAQALMISKGIAPPLATDLDNQLTAITDAGSTQNLQPIVDSVIARINAA